MTDVALPPMDDDLTVRQEGDKTLLLVKGSTPVKALSGAILNLVREGRSVMARAIGAGAVNQAAKGCAIARALAKEEGYDITCAVEFVSVRIKGEDRNSLCFTILAARP